MPQELKRMENLDELTYRLTPVAGAFMATESWLGLAILSITIMFSS
jgi:hypothetical protein